MPRSIYVHDASELPAREHWAIIEGSSVTVPGDERSRQSPGHGYPEHTNHFITYEAFTDRAEFEAELRRRLESAAKPGFGSYKSIRIRGIHVTETFSGKTHIAITLEGE